jgi:hypothetical protein
MSVRIFSMFMVIWSIIRSCSPWSRSVNVIVARVQFSPKSRGWKLIALIQPFSLETIGLAALRPIEGFGEGRDHSQPALDGEGDRRRFGRALAQPFMARRHAPIQQAAVERRPQREKGRFVAGSCSGKCGLTSTICTMRAAISSGICTWVRLSFAGWMQTRLSGRLRGCGRQGAPPSIGCRWGRLSLLLVLSCLPFGIEHDEGAHEDQPKTLPERGCPAHDWMPPRDRVLVGVL